MKHDLDNEKRPVKAFTIPILAIAFILAVAYILAETTAMNDVAVWWIASLLSCLCAWFCLMTWAGPKTYRRFSWLNISLILVIIFGFVIKKHHLWPEMSQEINRIFSWPAAVSAIILVFCGFLDCINTKQEAEKELRDELRRLESLRTKRRPI